MSLIWIFHFGPIFISLPDSFDLILSYHILISLSPPTSDTRPKAPWVQRSLLHFSLCFFFFITLMLPFSGDQCLMSACPFIDDVNSNHLVKVEATRFLICSKFINFPFVIIVITCSSPNLHPIILEKLMILPDSAVTRMFANWWLCQFHHSFYFY